MNVFLQDLARQRQAEQLLAAERRHRADAVRSAHQIRRRARRSEQDAARLRSLLGL
ncbi:hypothetical protein K8Z61_06605 [Nocardioides sp. TRM66260-LWL]|uniref:hypothetical protein n=1 Tax=Nocardioides sp. TRM66260-LWL TaxID=2874478 RepID=UPI001CC5AA03|nr:hypothetical protein [Nocardioides sp. TRM66260-LWL]MBZ5734162.1 hypothetical protein [Nocardioides sp. TRM66260-LWL]